MTEPLFVPATFTPTREQQAIQAARARHVLIEANAGAAKTTTLALRIAQALLRGAEPARILALTYSGPAVEALARQLRVVGVPAEALRAIRIETFESFCTAVLTGLEGEGTQLLLSQEQLKPYLLRAVERAQTWPQERYPDELGTDRAPTALVEAMLQSLAVIKGRLLVERLPQDATMTPELAEELGFDYLTLRVASAYEAIRRGGHPDHPAFRFEGDATYDLARLLLQDEEFPSDAAPLAQGLALIVVDEMHDTNRAMFTVLKALLEQNRRAAFVGVGDRDQVIHAQAGAEAAFMHEHFVAEIGMPTRLPLTASHRFGPRLAAAAGALAGKPYAAFGAHDTALRLLPGESPRVMARQVALAARDHLAQSQHRELRILLRRPAHSILIERELLKLGVGHAIHGFRPFLQRREVLLVRGLQALAIDDFSGFASRPQRAQLLEALMLFAGAWIDSTELRHLDAVTAQRHAIDEVAATCDGLRTFIEGQVLRNASDFARARLQAALAMLATRDRAAFARGFVEALDPAGLAGAVLVRREDVHGVRDGIVQLVQLVAGEDEPLDDVFQLLHALELAQARLRGEPRVSLSSIEAAKGLEFDHVLVPHLSRGEFVGEGGAAENRNLLYVAMTRARHCLSLAFDPAKPSRFLRDAGLLAD